MLWEAFLLFSPIRMSAGQYQGRRRAKRVNRASWNWPSGERKRLKSGRRSVKAVADAFDAVERDAAHGGEAGDGGGLHVDEGGVVGGGEAALFGRSATLGLVASQSSPAPASQLKALAGADVDDAGDVVGRAGGDFGAERSGPADGEDEIDGAAVLDGGEGARGGSLAGSGAGGDPFLFLVALAPRSECRCGCCAARPAMTSGLSSPGMAAMMATRVMRWT